MKIPPYHACTIFQIIAHFRCPLTRSRGNPGDEILDDQFNFANTRRRSNSSGFHNIQDFKTKFDMNEVEPVFEERVHGPEAEADDELTKTDSASTTSGSVDENPVKSV